MNILQRFELSLKETKNIGHLSAKPTDREAALCKAIQREIDNLREDMKRKPSGEIA